MRRVLPAVLRRLQTRPVPRRLLETVDRWGQLRGLPVDDFRRSGARPVHLNGEFVVSRPDGLPRVVDRQRAHLDELVRVLDEQDVGHFVVSTSNGQPWRVAVSSRDQQRVVVGLRGLVEAEPIYLVVRGRSGTRRAAVGARFSQSELEAAAAVGLYRIVDDPVTGVAVGETAACWLDFWQEGDDGRLTAPVPNRSSALVTAAERRDVMTVGSGPAAGHQTLRSLARAGPFDVTFPIDVVYLWVDDADDSWRARRDARLVALGGEPSDVASHQFRSHDELRYSLRSLRHHAPWVRQVYLLTDAQRPSWLIAEHPRLTVVDHRDVLPSECLPTFNSHAISASVHHIDGLSEHFLLMNDDVILGGRVDPEDFFHANGVAKFFLSNSAIPTGPISQEDAAHVAARKRVRDLVSDAHGIVPRQTFKHTPVPLVRSMLSRLEETFPDAYERTFRSPFRSRDDVVVSWLHHYIAYAEGRAVPGKISYEYFNLGSPRAFRRLAALLQGREVQCLCLNDVPEAAVAPADRAALVSKFLDAFLPVPSEFERPQDGAMDPQKAAASFRALVEAL